MAGLVGVLQSLGATRQRDGAYALDCSALQLGSMFGGDLGGPAVVIVTGEAITFRSPPELAACGKVWMTDVADEDTFCQALGVALDELREQTRAALGTLRRLGFKARIQAPDPRARGSITREGHVIDVVVDASGDLVVEGVDGTALPTSQQASLMAPDEAEPDEVNQLLEQVLLGIEGGESTGIVPPALSEEELNELQAALSDDDDDSDGFDDGDERTAAGVPMPAAARPGAAASDDSDEDASDDIDISDDGDALETGTVELRVQGGPSRPPPPAPEAFDDDDDEPPTATLTTPIAKPLGQQITIPAPPRPAVRQQVEPAPAPRDEEDDDGDPFDGAGEPTATRPAGGRSTAVPPSIAATRDAGGGLLDAFDDDDEGDGGDAFDDRPTSVRGADGSSVPAAEPARRPAGGAFDDDDDVPSTSQTGPGPATGDDEAEGKTRALIIDADLLARLKRGDGDKVVAQQAVVPRPGPPMSALPTAPSRPTPQHPADDFDAPSTSATTNLQVPATRGEHEPPSLGPTGQGGASDDDDESEITGAFAEAFDSGLDVAVDDPNESDDDDGSDDAEIDEATATIAPIPSRPPPRVADDEIDDDADGFDDGTQNAPVPGVTGADDIELQALQARAVALETELEAVRARIDGLLRHRARTEDPTGTATAQQRPSPPQPRVGDSDEGDAPATAGNGGFTSLPSLQSVDVHEVKASGMAPPLSARSNSLLDDFDDEDAAAAAGFDDGDDAAPAPAPPGRRPPPTPEVADGDDEDVVSLAALQEELAQEGNATQVAASVMDFAPADDDDGDVFGSAGGGDDGSLVDEESLASREAELSVEATRIRTSRLSSIALVVEDDRARDRLKKHLAERFSALIEAPDGPAILRMKGIADVDAIVFVRPRHDDANVGSLGRLEALPHRPRVLVISHDDAFDDLGAVDLRLPLGQRASEVAQQVLDGLERLGITLAPAA